MNINKGRFFAWLFVTCGILFFLVNALSYASEQYHQHGTRSTTNTNTVASTTECSGSAISAAAGQHHYRSTDRIQWSAGGAYANGVCDSSAASFGLGAQLGKIFAAGSYSTDGHSSVIGFSINGKF